MEKKFGLAKNCRLRLQREFEDVFNTGTKVSACGIVLWHKSGPSEVRRIGIVVSKKLGNAAQRNRAKRLIREVFRLNKDKLKSGSVLIMSPRNSEYLDNITTAQDAVLKLWRKAGLTEDGGAEVPPDRKSNE